MKTNSNLHNMQPVTASTARQAERANEQHPGTVSKPEHKSDRQAQPMAAN